MELQSQSVKQETKASNPLNNIAENLGVTPKVLTQLATGEDREFRELVRGIFSILPENEITLVASDADIHPEFLDYLSHLFESNQTILLAILQNPSSSKQTKQYILERLPEDTLSALAKNPETSPEIVQVLIDQVHIAEQSFLSSSQSEEFKIKMKVSKLLNDLEANLGVTIDAFLQIRARDDVQSQEFVREVYSALPEDNVLLVARDTNTSSKILDYLSRLFDSNHNVLLTILHNPSSKDPTKHLILEQLPEKIVLELAGNDNTPAEVLRFLSEHFTSSVNILATLLANPSTPLDVKEAIQVLSESEDLENLSGEELGQLEELEEPAEQMERTLPDTYATTPDEKMPAESGNVDAKIALCVDKLYDINADIMTEFIKKARTEILKRLNLVAKANSIILKTIVTHPSLTIDELAKINMDIFASLLKKSPDNINEKIVLDLIQQAKKES